MNNAKYPGIAEEYRNSYKKLKTLPCDVFLAPHAGFYGMAGKVERLERGEKPNPFVDPGGWTNFIDNSEKSFLKELAKEEKKP